MSVLIKGMEMPKNCDECFFVGRGFPDWCSLPQIPKDEDEIDDTNNRPDWCPLEELPSAQLEKVDTPTVDTPTCEDAVSRQAVYNVLDKMPVRGFKKDGETIHGLISLSQVNSAIIDLPSVQPNIPTVDTEDLIVRGDAIEAVNKRIEQIGYDNDPYVLSIRQAVRDVPSAQPEPLDEWCTDCKEYDHERHCCPRWNRVIRQTLKDVQPEIVRCKDCKYWREGTVYSYCDKLFGMGVLDAYDYMTDEDDYCSMAERRTDEQTN